MACLPGRGRRFAAEAATQGPRGRVVAVCRPRLADMAWQRVKDGGSRRKRRHKGLAAELCCLPPPARRHGLAARFSRTGGNNKASRLSCWCLPPLGSGVLEDGDARRPLEAVGVPQGRRNSAEATEMLGGAAALALAVSEVRRVAGISARRRKRQRQDLAAELLLQYGSAAGSTAAALNRPVCQRARSSGDSDNPRTGSPAASATLRPRGQGVAVGRPLLPNEFGNWVEEEGACRNRQHGGLAAEVLPLAAPCCPR